MDSKRITLLTITIVAVGIFALPSTVSLFSGQHTWYDLSGGMRISTNMPCEKCHADIVEEMKSSIGPHTGETGFGRMKCEYCHRVKWGNYRYATARGSEVTPGKKAHAASTVACMDCHRCINKSEFNAVVGGNHMGTPYFNITKSECSKCHGDPITAVPATGGFGLTNLSGDTGSRAAHMKFVTDAKNNTMMEDSNEACVACHTHTRVKINWTHAYSLEFNSSYKKGVYPPTHFNTSGLSVNGTINTTTYGNATGGGNTSGWNG